MHLKEHEWEQLFIDYFLVTEDEMSDASHDLSHFSRVYQTAKEIASEESLATDALVILAAAYFHDVVSLPKNHPDNQMSSRYAAIKAKEILQEMNFPSAKLEAVCHAIETHSFSARLEPQTLEAKIIQDADRMESLGALGIMRTFYVTGRLGREPFDKNDLYAERRPLDDKNFGFDHFYVKLLKLPDLLQTEGGRRLANQRAEFLQFFIEELGKEIKQGEGGVQAVVSACSDAGRLGLKLFDPLDPFAVNRPLDAALFAMDRLLEVQEQFPEFICRFLAQFQSEVGVSTSSIAARI